MVEHGSEAVVLEVQRAHRLAQAGLQGPAVLLCPGLKFVEAVVAHGGDVADPNTGHLTESQLALPAVPAGEVAVENLCHLQFLQGCQKNGDVVYPFHMMYLQLFSVHTFIIRSSPLSENPCFPNANGGWSIPWSFAVGWRIAPIRLALRDRTHSALLRNSPLPCPAGSSVGMSFVGLDTAALPDTGRSHRSATSWPTATTSRYLPTASLSTSNAIRTCSPRDSRIS